MPPKKKQKQGAAAAQHPIDASGVLQAAKDGDWVAFTSLLASRSELTFADFNTLPPGRAFGVLHQICYHSSTSALQQVLATHPRVDLTMLTKDGQTASGVAEAEGASPEFLDALRRATDSQHTHSLVSLARDGEWDQFHALLDEFDVGTDVFGAVPPGRTWGVVHQIAYWGEDDVLTAVLQKYPELDLSVATVEDACQTAIDIAVGRGHSTFAARLRSLVPAAAAPAAADTAPAAAAAAAPATAAAAAPAAAAVGPSSGPLEPIPASGRLCNICYSDDHDAGAVGVACDNDHFLCGECFCAYVSSESDTEGKPQSIIERGGRIMCVLRSSFADSCDSKAFPNKLIAMAVPDDLYETYLKARDFVVGKDAIAGVLSKMKTSSALAVVEQEQIRNLYRKANGQYAAYMCRACKFGPIDHFACADLNAHQGQQVGASQINNACPKCGWFAKQLAQWPKWDGTFHEGGKAAAAAIAAAKPPPSAELNGRRLVFTGKLTMERAEATARAVEAGAIVTKQISGVTELIVAGANSGSKIQQAEAQGIEVWSEGQFVAALGGH